MDEIQTFFNILNDLNWLEVAHSQGLSESHLKKSLEGYSICKKLVLRFTKSWPEPFPTPDQPEGNFKFSL